METGPLRERRVGDRRRLPDRRGQGERRTSKILMPVDLNRRQGLDRRAIILRRSIENRRVAGA